MPLNKVVKKISTPKPVKEVLTKKGATPISFFSIEPPPDNSVFSSANVEPYNSLSRVAVDKPEIIALSEFIPCYSRIDNNLNKRTLEFFQAKQDAQLVSCVDNIKNILELIKEQEAINGEEGSLLKNHIIDTTNEINSFCTDIESGINSFLSGIEDVKRSFDFKSNSVYIKQTIKNLNLNIPQDLAEISKIGEILDVSDPTWKKWYATKIWLQLCVKLKEALHSGISSKNGLFFINEQQNVEFNDSPYSLLKTYKINKVNFNTFQLKTISVFDENTILTEDSLTRLREQFRDVYSTPSNSILNMSVRELASDNPSLSIARLSYLITRELNYSIELRKLKYSNSKILSTYNYSENLLDKPNNIQIWNHIIGKIGNDITEIPSNNFSNSSLTSISQKTIENRAEQKTYEVLAFENRYINDDITSNGITRSATLTPGTIYYVDQTLTPTNFFNPTSARLFKDELSTATDSLINICSSTRRNDKSHFLFDLSIKPRRLTGTNTESSNNAPIDVKSCIKNPIYLIRFLEKNIIDKTKKSDTQAILSEKNLEDLSAPLISLALNTNKNFGNLNLLSLIYVYVLAQAHQLIKKDDTANSNRTTTKSSIDNIKTYLKLYSSDNDTYDSKKEKLVYDTFELKDSNFDLLNKIANIFVLFIEEFKKIDPESGEFDINDYPNPFNLTQDISRTFYSGIQKESLMSLLFLLCCLMIRETNDITITKLSTNQVQNIPPGSEEFPPDQLETFELMRFVFKKTTTHLSYDQTIVDAESKVWNESLNIKKTVGWFVSYLSILEKKLSNFINEISQNLTFDRNVYQPIKNIINNDDVASKILNVEQLNLIKSKLAYMKTRTSKNYDSGLKTIVPYFISLKNEDPVIINGILPLEDLHIASWNFLLKNYLKKTELNSPEANNLKILSAGVPHKWYQKLKNTTTNATTPNANIQNRGIVSVNVYLVDHLRPQLKHLPQKFIFDLQKFPIRILNYYLDAVLGTIQQQESGNFSEENEFAFINFLPFFNLSNFQNISELRAENAADLVNSNNNEFSYYSSVLNYDQIEQLRNNHMNSLFLEEYLRFTSGVSFDEQSFYNFEGEAKLIKDFSYFIDDIPKTDGAIDYLKNTIFVDVEEIKKSLISPKKFDRVLHVAVDPDNFLIDSENTKGNIMSYYAKNNLIIDKGNNVFQRSVAANREVEFNSYYIELEIIA